MNPNSGEAQPNFELAAPAENVNTQKPSSEKAPSSSPENKPKTPSVQISSQVASDLALPAQALTTTSVPQTDDDTTQPASGDAKDTDRIEQVWIDKAKAVVAANKDDPYEQKNALGRVKAEYIQKRFNKTVKVNDAGK